MELADLEGEYLLTACEPGHDGDANGLYFTLDGITVFAKEDENDGYRSMLDEIEVVETVLKNQFAPVKVIATLSDDNHRNTLVFRDAVTGKEVIEVGTDENDGYYPCFVADFSPENMVINRGVS